MSTGQLRLDPDHQRGGHGARKKNRRSRGRLSILACASGNAFAQRLVAHLNHLLDDQYGAQRWEDTCRRSSKEIFFSNNEVKTVITENIRGDDVYIVQCMDDPLVRGAENGENRRTLNDNLMALCTAIDAAYNADAQTITVVIPQYPYSRQERKKERESITARQIAMFLEASGADRVITLDIHAEPVEGFFRSAHFENIHASGPITKHIKQYYDLTDLTLVAPDVGSVQRARHYSLQLGTDLAIVDKQRDYSRPSSIENVRLIGSVEDRNVLIIDDMIATGGTIVSATKLLKENGARDIYLACSLPYFNGAAVEKLDAAVREGYIRKVIGTDAVFHGEAFVEKYDWYEEVSVAKLFADVIFRINQRESVSELLK
ncbi:phosphoribosylpyrophosphate synthetase [bacterium (Candidatus Blackallbacteria) CG17_big_fil_post_rev_8_21_14_2_50_48_46]|uniref:ribose-phosphate diphosphokinase n=1 Tax=bacterium (Candidatus Blackallbacteria) CG17_big_fil_post_rev_8_21_14_2_50_48_46 TaxID=2014261 RepID=A0A2M7G2E4_9BACT|nr:MAG: phosphoribosylpyrophosphate synthetase [bacterium (Candidatus Blackallbacteria) CG18_big_fil_WC_8_21_14_2_50_49_26]PIW15777.1 MAG: phosphoribosylpyrophosphate synthetase [bacterium (Candidatus Blackallbacteria) CG17_big_fil_post_rev_8_21_14_2_50_48_46]PIW48725.1 MAG: phosphoribosylpyrophosphate synthetase [bacterium (Candidatus Blackallbacteria) CG13_big_fil_rev_8_21_14_2_50_49_14]